MKGPVGLVQGNFQLMHVHIRRKTEMNGQFFGIHDPYGLASAFPLSVQARSVENADGCVLAVWGVMTVYVYSI